jgi:hypothetical protein
MSDGGKLLSLDVTIDVLLDIFGRQLEWSIRKIPVAFHKSNILTCENFQLAFYF